MSRDACLACGAALVWARGRTGNPQPVTREPKPNGNVLLYRGEGGVLCAAVLRNELAEALREHGVPLRLNHFADCPKADRFR